MYGVNSYGVKKYADDSTGNSEEEYYSDLFPLVPPFISEKKEMHALYDTQGYAVGYLVHCMEDMMKQCFIATATWGLTRWEKFFVCKDSGTGNGNGRVNQDSRGGIFRWGCGSH